MVVMYLFSLESLSLSFVAVKGEKQRMKSRKPTVLPDDLVFEMLRWVPRKHLVECKCVCKSWRAMIESPQFLEVRCRPGLMVCYEEPYITDPTIKFPDREPTFFYCSLKAGEGPSENFNYLGKVPVSVRFMKLHLMTQIIDGITCNFGFKSPKILNVHTGESMRLPEPNLPEYDRKQKLRHKKKLYLGYVPSDGVYKLLKLHDPNKFVYKLVSAEILTLGDPSPSWRELQDNDVVSTDCPSSAFALEHAQLSSRSSYSADGFIYWIVIVRDGPPMLLSFDLKQEKFRWINLPHYLVIRYGQRSQLAFWSLNVIHSMGRVALWLPPGTVEDECFRLFTSEENGTFWNTHIVRLPPELKSSAMFVDIIGHLPNGQILMLNPEMATESVPVYSYDHLTNKFIRYEVGKIPQPVKPILCEWLGHPIKTPFMISCGIENLKPLKVALRCGRK